MKVTYAAVYKCGVVFEKVLYRKIWKFKKNTLPL